MADMPHAYREVIRDSEEARPRSQQLAIGASGVGTPCDRLLLYRLARAYGFNLFSWPAFVGSAVHERIASAFEFADDGRYLIEQEVTCGYLPDGSEVKGHCDLYDTDTDTVVDWKTTSAASIKQIRAKVFSGSCPSEQYRIQAHLYGAGMVMMGKRPKRVSLMFVPTSGNLTYAVEWSEAFDPQVVVAAFNRMQTLWANAERMGWAEAVEQASTDPTACWFCPFKKLGSIDSDKGKLPPCPCFKADDYTDLIGD